MRRGARLAAAIVALALAAAAHAASPSDELTARAGARMQRGDLKGALADANAALARDSRSSPAYAVRGTIRMTLGDRKGAIADLTRSIELTPEVKEMAIVYANRAHLHWQDRNAVAAAADVAKALALDPGLAIAYSGRARLKADAGDLDGARADYDRAIAIDSKLLAAYAGRAAVNLQAGRLEESIGDYKSLMWIFPRNAEVMANHGIVRGLLGDTPGAIKDLLRARAIDPATVSDARGASLRPAQALEQYLQMNPNEARAHLMHGVLAFMNGKPERGEQDLARAVQLDPALARDAEQVRARR